MTTDSTPAPLTDEQLRAIAADGDVSTAVAEQMAAELLAAGAVTPETSDGYHTFAELYHYRMLYNAALFNEWAAANRYAVHKSIRHADGELCFGGGWFVVYAQLPTGQISNHYEMTQWDRFRIPERDRADEWDGHTPQQVAERLAAFLKLGPGGPRFSQRHLEQVTGERDAARARIAELEAELEYTRRGAETLGGIVDRQCRDALKATGMHHLIGEDGDGDWGAVWERLAEMGAELNGLREVAEHRLEVIREMAAEIAAARDRIAQLEAERDAARQVMTDHRCGDQAERAYRRAATAEARVAELEAQQPKPAGYIVGWQDGDRVEIALDESELPDLLPGPDRHAYTSIGEAHAFLAEIAPEDTDTQFRVYVPREVSDRG
ncbi:WDGH domain-containing protein [Nocardia cyriacigeorgica]|uniref:WDGH domain-containing protein n=1 Tax=Nocardia cyriacigeorgica TaxID=135487 RepID=UPI0018953CFA|nr:hypothetical protein [Nocardia cyriacigeorgica]MBF6416928.1 hypothetical protein [Nocardia cyriacigeorgica]